MGEPWGNPMHECTYCGEVFEEWKDKHGDLWTDICKDCSNMNLEGHTMTVVDKGAKQGQVNNQWRVMDGAILSDKINDYGNFIVVSCERERTKQDEDNLNLIAMAPKLLESLKALLADIEDYQRINHLGGENNQSQFNARAAIAKAEGRA